MDDRLNRIVIGIFALALTAWALGIVLLLLDIGEFFVGE